MNWNKLSFILAIVLVVLGVSVFMTGLHDIDNAWNMKYVELQGMKLVDNNLLLSDVDPNSLYSLGIVIVFIGFILTIIAIISASLVFKIDN